MTSERPVCRSLVILVGSLMQAKREPHVNRFPCKRSEAISWVSRFCLRNDSHIKPFTIDIEREVQHDITGSRKVGGQNDAFGGYL